MQNIWIQTAGCVNHFFFKKKKKKDVGRTTVSHTIPHLENKTLEITRSDKTKGERIKMHKETLCELHDATHIIGQLKEKKMY